MLKPPSIIMVLGFALLLLGCVGCSSVSEPAFLTDAPNDNKDHSVADQVKYKGLSNESAQLGWYYLGSYFNKDSFVPAVNKSYIANAMECFNYCWSFDNENYQAYWGAGVVRGVQATLTDDPLLAEKYLKQSIEFMLLARKHHVPANQSNNLSLDLSNSYNGLGAFYLQTSKKELADANLELARTTLLDVIKKEPENGRAFFLLAATSFYQGRYGEVKQLADQAKNKHYKVPDDFLKNLSSKITATMPPLKSL